MSNQHLWLTVDPEELAYWVQKIRVWFDSTERERDECFIVQVLRSGAIVRHYPGTFVFKYFNAGTPLFGVRIVTKGRTYKGTRRGRKGMIEGALWHLFKDELLDLLKENGFNVSNEPWIRLFDEKPYKRS